MIEHRPSPSPDTQEIIAEIKKTVSSYYESLDAWHNLSHGARVVAMALEINRTEGADPFLVEAGAWLHQYHRPNLELLKPVLDSLPIKDSVRIALYQIVSLCRPDLIGSRPEPLSDETWKAAQVVSDGDALDLMGPSGLFREVMCNAACRNMSHTEALTQAREVQELFAATIQTVTGNRIAHAMNEPLKAFWAEHDRYEAFIQERGASSY